MYQTSVTRENLPHHWFESFWHTYLIYLLLVVYFFVQLQQCLRARGGGGGKSINTTILLLTYLHTYIHAYPPTAHKNTRTSYQENEGKCKQKIPAMRQEPTRICYIIAYNSHICVDLLFLLWISWTGTSFSLLLRLPCLLIVCKSPIEFMFLHQIYMLPLLYDYRKLCYALSSWNICPNLAHGKNMNLSWRSSSYCQLLRVSPLYPIHVTAGGGLPKSWPGGNMYLCLQQHPARWGIMSMEVKRKEAVVYNHLHLLCPLS